MPTPDGGEGRAREEIRVGSGAAARENQAQEQLAGEPAFEAEPVAADELKAGEFAGHPSAPSPITQLRRPRGRRGIFFWAALIWIALVAFAALTATFLPIKDPNEINVGNRLADPFSGDHILGADGLGRDIFSRVIYGARVSLTISVAAVVIGMVVGGTLGMVVGYFRGRLETLVMAVVDVILAFPGLVLLLALVAFVGQSLTAITLVIGFLSIPVYTRVARATTLAVAQREFVLAAQAMGATHRRIIFREIMPNVVLPVMAFGLVALGVIIVLEGSLAFLNLSVQAPQATWGAMIAEGKRHLTTTAHVAFIPSLVMFLTVLSLNFVGDSFRSRFDVRESTI